MSAFIDLAGKTFGRLTVLERAGSNKHKKALWKCTCSCGVITTVIGSSLTKGKSTSCGCFRTDLASKLNKTHGKSNTKIYMVWKDMNRRCCDISDINYGGRGISVCGHWRYSFKNFYVDMGDLPFPGATLDRINNNSEYSPENCRWATMREQANNTRRNHYLHFAGQTLTLSQWARKLGFPPYVLWKRLSRGWSVSKTLTRPLGRWPV